MRPVSIIRQGDADTIFVVFASTHGSRSRAVRGFDDRCAADDFVASCIRHERHRPLQPDESATAAQIALWLRQFDLWLSEHPACGAAGEPDYFRVVEIPFGEVTQGACELAPARAGRLGKRLAHKLGAVFTLRADFDGMGHYYLQVALSALIGVSIIGTVAYALW